MLSSGLGVKLKQLREAVGLTQQVLAARADVSYSTVSKLEQGSVTRPSIKTLQKLVGVLGYDLDLLVDDKPLPQQYLRRASHQSHKVPIKFVYFDIGGVLAHTESMLLQNLAHQFNRPLGKVKELYYAYSPLAMRGRLQVEDVQLLFLFRLHLNFSTYKKYLFTDWVDHMRANSAVHEFATEVARHYQIGLLTNIIDGVYERMQERQLVPDLPYKTVVQSCKVGLIKPERPIYELATQLSGHRPEDILFIDDQKVNIKAAREYGWHAEWFNETKTTASLARIRRKYF